MIMKLEQLKEAVYTEWRNLHHNASLSGYFPDFQNDYEQELFWNVLGDEVSIWIDDLQENIKDQFGHELKFYSYGRMGATIAPSDWMQRVGGHSFGSFSEEKAIGYGFDSSIDEFNAWRKVLAVLKYINEFWHETAKATPEWWEDAKEANAWQAQINKHDGMVKRTKEVWVKEVK